MNNIKSLLILGLFCFSLNEISYADYDTKTSMNHNTDVDQGFNRDLSYCFQLPSNDSDLTVRLTEILPMECDPVLESGYHFSSRKNYIIETSNPIVFLKKWISGDFFSLTRLIKINGFPVSVLMQTEKGMNLIEEVAHEMTVYSKSENKEEIEELKREIKSLKNKNEKGKLKSILLWVIDGLADILLFLTP